MNMYVEQYFEAEADALEHLGELETHAAGEASRYGDAWPGASAALVGARRAYARAKADADKIRAILGTENDACIEF